MLAMFSARGKDPDRAGPALIKLVLGPDYPEIGRVLQLLADAPPQQDEFRQVLLKLQRHPNRTVSKAAMRIYHHLDPRVSVSARLAS
jgi:hypothetical protein